MTLTTSDLDGQFIFCQDPLLVPLVWGVREKGSWILGTHPSLPVVSILSAQGEENGCILSHATNLDSEILSDQSVFNLNPDNLSQLEEQIEDQFYSLCDRFPGIISLFSIEMLYPDPGSWKRGKMNFSFL